MTGDIEIPQQRLFIKSVVKPSDMLQAVEEYQELVSQLLTDADIVRINGKKFIKKSGWYKLAVPFNITTEIIEEVREWLNDEKTLMAYHFTVRAKVGNTRHVDEVGSCDNTVNDKSKESAHVVRTMAKTRATSRAIASIIGATEQSAEDMEFVKSNSFSKSPEEDTRPPSEKQLAFLIDVLKYNGQPPKSITECSDLIEKMKAETQ